MCAYACVSTLSCVLWCRMRNSTLFKGVILFWHAICSDSPHTHGRAAAVSAPPAAHCRHLLAATLTLPLLTSSALNSECELPIFCPPWESHFSSRLLRPVNSFQLFRLTSAERFDIRGIPGQPYLAESSKGRWTVPLCLHKEKWVTRSRRVLGRCVGWHSSDDEDHFEPNVLLNI